MQTATRLLTDTQGHAFNPACIPVPAYTWAMPFGVVVHGHATVVNRTPKPSNGTSLFHRPAFTVDAANLRAGPFYGEPRYWSSPA